MKLSRLALAVALLPGVQVFAAELTRDEALKLSDTVVSANREPRTAAPQPNPSGHHRFQPR